MFSLFNHVMKSVRDTNSEPGSPVSRPPFTTLLRFFMVDGRSKSDRSWNGLMACRCLCART